MIRRFEYFLHLLCPHPSGMLCPIGPAHASAPTLRMAILVAREWIARHPGHGCLAVVKFYNTPDGSSPRVGQPVLWLATVLNPNPSPEAK